MQCHGEHTLVEIFNKRNFTCDCGTTRFPATVPCTRRLNPVTNTKGGVHSEEPDPRNRYNQNFRNRFCSCECDYDPFQQKGTMFQCLGLGTTETGGCGEDWYHPGCLVGMGPNWFEKMPAKEARPKKEENGTLAPVAEEGGDQDGAGKDHDMDGEEDGEEEDEDDVPLPPGFPAEDDFEGFICFKCVEANPWIKRYAGTDGFLPPVYLDQGDEAAQASEPSNAEASQSAPPKKRRAEDDEDGDDGASTKKARTADGDASQNSTEAMATQTTTDPAGTQDSIMSTGRLAAPPCKLDSLRPGPPNDGRRFSLFFTSSFRDRLCHCRRCFPFLKPYPQLLEEEETYEPPLSEDDGSEAGGTSLGSGSLLERGESALRNIDRVRAIEGVMAYNQLKDKLKPFFQQFAESGKAISAEDIKEYFAKLRGDDQAIRAAGESAATGRTDFREEQDGY